MTRKRRAGLIPAPGTNLLTIFSVTRNITAITNRNFTINASPLAARLAALKTRASSQQRVVKTGGRLSRTPLLQAFAGGEPPDAAAVRGDASGASGALPMPTS